MNCFPEGRLNCNGCRSLEIKCEGLQKEIDRLNKIIDEAGILRGDEAIRFLSLVRNPEVNLRVKEMVKQAKGLM